MGRELVLSVASNSGSQAAVRLPEGSMRAGCPSYFPTFQIGKDPDAGKD